MTLKTLGTTKRFNTKNIEQGFKEKFTTRRIGKRTFKTKTTSIKLTTISSERIKNTDVTREFRTRSRRGTVGKLKVNITFVGKGKRKTVSGYSQQLRDLSDSGQLAEAYDEAFSGALSLIDFSYDYYLVNYVHYSYRRTPRSL